MQKILPVTWEIRRMWYERNPDMCLCITLRWMDCKPFELSGGNIALLTRLFASIRRRQDLKTCLGVSCICNSSAPLPTTPGTWVDTQIPGDEYDYLWTTLKIVPRIPMPSTQKSTNKKRNERISQKAISVRKRLMARIQSLKR